MVNRQSTMGKKMESDIILETARRLESDARTWCYHLGNHAGGVSVDELRNAVSLIRDLAQVVAELAQLTSAQR